jgi:virulence factor Mce-like protein
VAPPLVKGRALARRRLSGIAFLIVIALLVQLAIWLYQKRFVDVVDVSLKTDRIGNQLSKHADVKLRGLIVGEVRSVRSDGGVATLQLALDPKKAALVPRDVRAQLLPKTLFGEKQVVLVAPESPSSEHLRDGDVISQDRSTTALETERALNDLLPLLKALRPQDVSTFLTNVSTAVRGRGDRVGENAVSMAAYFKRINPKLPDVGADFAGLADLADNLADTSPDLLRELDNLAASSRNLSQEKDDLDTFLTSFEGFARETDNLVRTNERRLTALSRDSVAPLQLYRTYSDTYACLLNRLAFAEIEGERVFGGGQTGLHITLEGTRDNGGYRDGDEPLYGEDMNAHCFGLGKTPIRPFPEYANPKDGYRDGEPPADPGKGPGGCCETAGWADSPAARPGYGRTTAVADRPTLLDVLLTGPLG